MANTSTPALTPDEITALLAGTRNRGGHDTFVRAFIDSNDMYATVNENPSYKHKTPEQLATSVKQGILAAVKRLDNPPTIKCIMNGDDLLIINTDKVADSFAQE